MLHGKQSACVYHIWFEGLWLFALVVSCSKLDVVCFLNYFKSGWYYVSWDFWIVSCNLKILHVCKKKEPVPRHHVYFSSGGTVFKNKGLQNFQLHFSAMTQCSWSIYKTMTRGNHWAEGGYGGGGEAAAQFKSLFTNIMICYLTVGCICHLEIFSSAGVCNVLRFICVLSKHLWLKCGRHS